MAKRASSPSSRPAPMAARPTTTSASGFTPDEDAVRRRAYEIYVSRGPGSGSPLEDWLQAERELNGRRRMATAGN